MEFNTTYKKPFINVLEILKLQTSKKMKLIHCIKKELDRVFINAGDMRMQYVGKRKVAIIYIDSSTL